MHNGAIVAQLARKVLTINLSASQLPLALLRLAALYIEMSDLRKIYFPDSQAVTYTLIYKLSRLH